VYGRTPSTFSVFPQGWGMRGWARGSMIGVREGDERKAETSGWGRARKLKVPELCTTPLKGCPAHEVGR